VRDHRPFDTESKVLSEPVAARLLERASELDAARSAGLQVEELRAAATQAGISASAFDAALDELQRTGEPAVAVENERRPRHRSRWTLTVGFVAMGAAFLLYGIGRNVAPVEAVVQRSFPLQCLSLAEAGALIRPILAENGVAYAPANAQRVLTVRATQAQIDKVRSVLDQQESAGSPACAVRAGSAPR